jgi:hypothetical protein
MNGKLVENRGQGQFYSLPPFLTETGAIDIGIHSTARNASQ